MNGVRGQGRRQIRIRYKQRQNPLRNMQNDGGDDGDSREVKTDELVSIFPDSMLENQEMPKSSQGFSSIFAAQWPPAPFPAPAPVPSPSPTPTHTPPPPPPPPPLRKKTTYYDANFSNHYLNDKRNNNENIFGFKKCGNCEDSNSENVNYYLFDTLISPSSSSQNEDSYSDIKLYEKKVSEVDAQNQVVKKINKEISISQEALKKISDKYEKQITFLTTNHEKFKQLNIKSSLQEFEIQKANLKKAKETFSFIEADYQKVTNTLFQKKRVLDQELRILKEKEIQLINLRDNVEKFLSKIGIIPKFTDEFGGQSKQFKKFHQPQKISEFEFVYKFQQGDVSNNAFELDTEKWSLKIKISGQIVVKNLSVKNVGQGGLQYLQIDLSSPEANVCFEDCEFIGVGVAVYGYEWERKGSVSFKNVEVRDAPGLGLVCAECNTCTINGAQIDNCQKTGIYISSKTAFVMDANINKCIENGIFFQKTTGKMINCQIKNCSRYGLLVSEGFKVCGQSVQFKNNFWGEFFGNYVDKDGRFKENTIFFPSKTSFFQHELQF